MNTTKLQFMLRLLFNEYPKIVDSIISICDFIEQRQDDIFPHPTDTQLDNIYREFDEYEKSINDTSLPYRLVVDVVRLRVYYCRFMNHDMELSRNFGDELVNVESRCINSNIIEFLLSLVINDFFTIYQHLPQQPVHIPQSTRLDWVGYKSDTNDFEFITTHSTTKIDLKLGNVSGNQKYYVSYALGVFSRRFQNNELYDASYLSRLDFPLMWKTYDDDDFFNECGTSHFLNLTITHDIHHHTVSFGYYIDDKSSPIPLLTINYGNSTQYPDDHLIDNWLSLPIEK